MKKWNSLAALLLLGMLSACGGSGDGGEIAGSVSTPPASLVPETGAPALTGVVAPDGLRWINFRRGQVGVPLLTENNLIDVAAQGHAEYMRANNIVAHEQVSGKTGFTGVSLLDRLNKAGYSFANASYAYGEVISAANKATGASSVDDLITAIYHRFVIFEPKFKEMGTGAATSSANYVYFTADFAANQGYGPGIGRTSLVVWPYNGQTSVTPNFFSDYEAPDPVPDANEVGYPISVHGDINTVLTVQSFSVRPRGGSDLAVRLLSAAGDHATPVSAAAIVPLAVLKAGTTYDVSFVGTIDSLSITKNWSFITK